MTSDDEDTIMVATGRERRGEVGTTPAGAGPPAASAAERSGGAGEPEGAEWAVVTRGRPRGRPKGCGGQQKIQFSSGTPTFEQASETVRKRKAEETMTERLEQVYALLEKVLHNQQERDKMMYRGADTSELDNLFDLFEQVSQKQDEQERLLKEQEKRMRELERLMKGQEKLLQEKTAEILHLLQQGGQRPAQGPGPSQPSQVRPATKSYADMARTQTGPTAIPRPFANDERAVTVNMTTAAAKTSDYAALKQTLQSGLDGHDGTKGARIACIRPRPAGGKVEVVFATKVDAAKAKKSQRWATECMPGARVQGEQWYPVKCDMVVKTEVLGDHDRENGKLKADLLEAFAKDNSVKGFDFTAAKARWVGTYNPAKALGSLVIWLKSSKAAEYLLRTGTAIFGATGAYCSKWEARIGEKPCFNCYQYGHKRSSCKGQSRCALCSGAHDHRVCPKERTKCPSCGNNGHSAFSWECKLHPFHKRYLTQRRPSSEEMDTTDQPANAPA